MDSLYTCGDIPKQSCFFCAQNAAQTLCPRRLTPVAHRAPERPTATAMQFTINAPPQPTRYARPAAFAAFDEEDEVRVCPEKPARDREACRRDGCTLAAAGRWGAALELFEEELALGGAPDVAVLHELRAQALLGLDRCFEAARAAEFAIAGAPDWAPAHATRARALLNFGEVEGAVQAFRRAASCAPDDPALRAELDESLVLESRLSDARRERLHAAQNADDTDIAEVNRCKAALRCTLVSSTSPPLDRYVVDTEPP